MTITIPTGLCQCGCGEPTRVAKNSNAAKGHRAGEPVRFRPGHHSRRTPLDRFLAHIEKDPETGCWLWTASLTEFGYGRLPVADVCRTAHRFAYLHFVGPIPDGRELDHLCRVPRCANPEHLEPVTHMENMERGDTTVALNRRRARGAA